MITYFGAGGLGDVYICFCKALAYNKLDFNFRYIHSVGTAQYDDFYHKEFLNMQRIADFEIIQQEPIEFFNKNKDLFPISTSWDGKKSGIIKDSGWLDPYIGNKIRIKSQEVLLIKPYILVQSSAGFSFNKRPDRMWSNTTFLNNLCKLINQKTNYSIYIIGKDDIKLDYPNIKDLSLGTHMNIVKNADLFLGFAGFLGFVAMTNRVPVIMKEHEYNSYYNHPAWRLKTFNTESYSTILNLVEREINEKNRFTVV